MQLRAPVIALLSGAAIAASAVASAEPAFPGGNGLIAFVTSPNDNADVYTVTSRGCELTRITTAAGRDLYPSFSPDGMKITYQRDFTNGLVTGSANWVINSDGTGAVQLTPATEGGDGRAEWAPDGKELTFRHETDPHRVPTERSWEIYTVKPDGSGLKRLTTNELAEDSPTYSPDGSRIAFTRRAATGDEFNPAPEEIWVMNSNGTQESQVTNNNFRDTDLQWAPVGNLVLYSSLRNGDSDLFVVDVTTGVETQLTSHALVERGAWRPDGQQIVYSTGNDIYVINPDGTGRDKLGTNIGKYPKYSPDGTQIVFSGADEFTVRTIPAAGGPARKVFGDRDTYLSGGPFLDWQPLSPQPPVVDVTAPSITNVRDIPDPFFPEEGGVTLIRFATSEHSFVTVTLHRNGTRVATAQSNKYECAGEVEVLWRGKAGGQIAPQGTYTYKIKATDEAGNVGRATGKVTLKR